MKPQDAVTQLQAHSIPASAAALPLVLGSAADVPAASAAIHSEITCRLAAHWPANTPVAKVTISGDSGPIPTTRAGLG